MTRQYCDYYRYELEPRHYVDEIMDPLSNIVGLTVRQFQSRSLVRDLISIWPDTVRLMRMDDLRWHFSMLTNADLMNVRFLTHDSEDDGSAVICFPGQAGNLHYPPPNLGALPWGESIPDESDNAKPLVTPPSSPEQSEITSTCSKEDPEVVFPEPNTDEPLSTPPKPG